MSAGGVVLSEGEFASSSSTGDVLHTYCWRPAASAGVPVRAVAFLALGLFDHAGRYGEFVERLVARGLAVYAMDPIGHGRSGGSRGQIGEWQVVVGDLHAFVVRTLAQSECHRLPYVIIAKAVGCVIATHVVQRVMADAAFARKPASFVMISPAGKIKQTFSFFAVRKAVARVASNVAPRMEIASFNVEAMNRDEAERRKYLDDPLVYHGNISSATAATMLKAIAAQDLAQITCPTLVIAAECENVVDRDAASSVFDSVSSATKVLKTLRGAWHDVVHDPEKEIVFADIGDWTDAVLAATFNDQNASVRVSDYPVDDGWISAVVPDSVFVRARMFAPIRQSSSSTTSTPATPARPSTPVELPSDASGNPADLPSPPSSSAAAAAASQPTHNYGQFPSSWMASGDKGPPPPKPPMPPSPREVKPAASSQYGQLSLIPKSSN
jgi:acylglycerol lipase